MINNKIKIFADGADYKSILNFNKKNFIKGLTTNPTLMKNRVLRIIVNLLKKY